MLLACVLKACTIPKKRGILGANLDNPALRSMLAEGIPMGTSD